MGNEMVVAAEEDSKVTYLQLTEDENGSTRYQS